jgi:hypothetical protein
MTSPRGKIPPLLLGVCALLGALAMGLAVPPFQFPDEPHHFAAVLIQAWGEDKRDLAEIETLRLMDRFDWWRLTGLGRPAVLPGRISEVKFLMADSRSDDFRDRIQGFVLYHEIAGRALALTGVRNPLAAYFLLRFLSIAFTVGGLAFLALALRTFVRSWDAELRWVLAFAVFLPQLSFAAAGVAPDAFVFLLGAAFLWAAVEIIASKASLARVIVLVAAAGLGFLSDRSAFVFGALLVLLPFFAIRRVNVSKFVGGTLLALVALILFAYVLALKFPLQFESGVRALESVGASFRRAIPRLGAFGPFERGFWLQLVDTSFLRFGWMHFAPPRAFVWVWRLVWLAGAGGLVVGAADFVRRRVRGRETENDAVRRRLILFSLAALFIQAFGLWTFYGSAHIMPQGRYLFPVLPAVLALMAAGVRRLGDAIRPGAGPRALPVLAVFLIFAWVFAFWGIVVPVFRMTVASPYPGV